MQEVRREKSRRRQQSDTNPQGQGALELEGEIFDTITTVGVEHKTPQDLPIGKDEAGFKGREDREHPVMQVIFFFNGPNKISQFCPGSRGKPG